MDGYLHVFQYRHGLERTHDLMGARHSELHQRRSFHSSHIIAAQLDAAGRRRKSSGDYAEECSLPCTVRSDEAADVTFGDFKAHVLQGGYAPKVLCQPLYFENLAHIF